MRPTQDAGVKPQEVTGALFPWLTVGQVLRYFLFITAICAPLWNLAACRLLRLPPSTVVWCLFSVLVPMWLYQNFTGFYRWGLVAFAFASYLAPLVLAAFQAFLAHPTWRSYVLAVLLLSFQSFLHVLGPVILAPVMVVEVVGTATLPKRWKIAAFAAPLVVAIVNSFWLVPFVLDFLLTPKPPGRPFATYPADLIYHSWDHLLSMLSPMRVVIATTALFFIAFGFTRFAKYSGKTTAVAFLVTGLLGIMLKFFGSFIPVIVLMQPSRFLLTAAAMLALPLGIGIERVCRLLHLSSPLACVFASILVVGFAGWKDRQSFNQDTGPQHVNFAGNTEIEGTGTLGLPHSIPILDFVAPLQEFVSAKTSKHDRILLQTRAQCEGKILAHVWQREVIGNAYPDQHDPANFLANRLFGRKLSDWSAEELRSTVRQWGINWVFTCTEAARKAFEQAYHQKGIEVGLFRAFHVADDQNRFLIGEGTIQSSVNYIMLRDLKPKNGIVVLRYRYHPAWSCDNQAIVAGYPVSGCQSGFLMIRTSSENVELTFSPLAIFTAKWPVAD